jgi:cell wall assembly regulator SMI1
MKCLWDRIHVWLAQNAPEVRRSLRRGASEAQLLAAEAKLGVRLPDDVRAAYRIHDGARLPFLYGWSWYSLTEMVAEWRQLQEFRAQGIFGDNSGRADGPVRPVWYDPAWVPITRSGYGHRHCLDFAPARRGRVGQVILWQNDDLERIVEAESFADWLEDFIEEMEEELWTTSEGYEGLVEADEP